MYLGLFILARPGGDPTHIGAMLCIRNQTIQKTPNGRQQVVFNYDHGADRTPDALIVRQWLTTTTSTGCQFSVLAKESLDKASWKLTHRLRSKCAIHNHEPSTQRSAHPVHRKLSDADESTVHKLANAGVIYLYLGKGPH